MIKNLRVQVLMGVDQYNQLHNYCTDHQIKYKNDSDMFRKILFKFINEGESAQTQIYIMGNQIKDQKEKIQYLENSLDRIEKEFKDLEIKNIQLDQKLKKAKKKVFRKA
jgi:septal ring factor EnvC (AmiA/AmiB activator)